MIAVSEAMAARNAAASSETAILKKSWLKEDRHSGQVQTEDRVKHFQRKSGVAVDGVVGPVTWQLLSFT